MPILTSCPSCERPLRVPDNLIGTAVKCPSCATIWTVREIPLDSPPHTEPSDVPPEETQIDAYRDNLPARESSGAEFERIREAPSEPILPSPPPPPSAPQLDDLEEEDEDDPEYFERLENRRRERLRRNYTEDAKSKVMGPAIGLIVTASITLLSALLNIGYGVFQAVMLSSVKGGPGAAPPPTGVVAVAGGIYGLMALFYIIMGSVMLIGALQFMKLRRYHLCMASCILAIIPCQGCCYITGIPFGIWGLVVLLDPKVKSVFTVSRSSSAAAE